MLLHFTAAIHVICHFSLMLATWSPFSPFHVGKISNPLGSVAVGLAVTIRHRMVFTVRVGRLNYSQDTLVLDALQSLIVARRSKRPTLL